MTTKEVCQTVKDAFSKSTPCFDEQRNYFVNCLINTVFISEYFQKLHLIYISFFPNIKDGKIISKNKKPLIKIFQLMGLASKKKICCNKKGKIFVEKWVSVNDNLPAICKTLPFINRDLICL